MIFTDTFEVIQIITTQMFAHHSVNFITLQLFFKHEAFNNRVVHRKIIKAIASLV